MKHEACHACHAALCSRVSVTRNILIRPSLTFIVAYDFGIGQHALYHDVGAAVFAHKLNMLLQGTSLASGPCGPGVFIVHVQARVFWRQSLRADSYDKTAPRESLACTCALAI